MDGRQNLGFQQQQQQPQHDLASLDTVRNAGLKSTSLDVLSNRKTHKTHTQKQFRQFTEQQQQQQRLMSLQSRDGSSEFLAPHYGQVQGPPQPFPQAPHPQFYHQRMLPGSPVRQSPTRSVQSFHSMSSAQYPGASSALLQQSILPPSRLSSPTKRLNSLSSVNNNHLADLNDSTVKVSPLLIQSEWEKPFHEERLKEVEAENEELLTQKSDLIKKNEDASGQIDNLNDKIRTLTMELNKLKLQTRSLEDSKNAEISNLTKKNSQLQENVEKLTALNEKSSSNTTPLNSPRCLPSKGPDVSAGSITSGLTTSSISARNAENPDDDLVTTLINTLHLLKNERSILKDETNILTNKLKTQKQITQKLARLPTNKLPKRSGIRLVECSAVYEI